MSYYSDKIKTELLVITESLQASIDYMKNNSYENKVNATNKISDAIIACKIITEIAAMIDHDISNNYF